MSPDRAEIAGTGAALAFHVALIAALSLSLAHVPKVPEPPSMEVELVDEVGLAAAAPSTIAVPPPPSTAPDIADANPAEPTPLPSATPLPPATKVVPTPAPRAIERATAKPVKALPSPARPTAKASRIGADFLKGIATDSPAKATAPRAASAHFDAAAKADIASAIAAQIRPCALNQRDLGPGANRIRVVLNLKLFLNGRLKGAPSVVRTSGVDDDNRQYEELVKDQAIASYRECAPLRLPAELYQTPEGGWSNINLTYRVP